MCTQQHTHVVACQGVLCRLQSRLTPCCSAMAQESLTNAFAVSSVPARAADQAAIFKRPWVCLGHCSFSSHHNAGSHHTSMYEMLFSKGYQHQFKINKLGRHSVQYRYFGHHWHSFGTSKFTCSIVATILPIFGFRCAETFACKPIFFHFCFALPEQCNCIIYTFVYVAWL